MPVADEVQTSGA